LARRRRERDTESRSIEGATGLLEIGADIRQQIGSALAHAGLCLVDAESRALGNRALSRGETGGITEGQRDGSSGLDHRIWSTNGNLLGGSGRSDGNGRNRRERAETRAEKGLNHY
jgi:hypothetical protein